MKYTLIFALCMALFLSPATAAHDAPRPAGRR
jgi:hypothetical protein